MQPEMIPDNMPPGIYYQEGCHSDLTVPACTLCNGTGYRKQVDPDYDNDIFCPCPIGKRRRQDYEESEVPE